MSLIPNMLTRRLILALVIVFGAFILWLVPSFVVMAPDHNYAERMQQEAELVAAAIARGGLASRPPSRIGGNPKDPRTIAARNRSVFHRRRVEGILRHMYAITRKRIVLYDHRRNIIMDSYNFTSAQQVTAQDLPPPDPLTTATPNPRAPERFNPERANPNYPNQTSYIDEPDYLPPPRGDSAFVRAALEGKQSRTRKIIQKPSQNFGETSSAKNQFRPRQEILQAIAPIQRLKLVQGAVILIDTDSAGLRAWRWQALFDSTPVFAAFIVALVLLLLWLKSAMISPLARLAYGDQPLDGSAPEKSRRAKRGDEIEMISRRHRAGQITALNFAEASRALSTFQKSKAEDESDHVQVQDSKMASQIHLALINAKRDIADISPIIQRCISRHNLRAQKAMREKMCATNSKNSNISSNMFMPFGDSVILEKVKTGQTRNAFHLPIFSHALHLVLDYVIQGAAASAPKGWPDNVRVALVRQRRTIRIIIEDDGPDLASHDLTAWTARAYDLQNPPLYTQRALETCIAMHQGRFVITSLRPARIAIILPLPNQKLPNQKEP